MRRLKKLLVAAFRPFHLRPIRMVLIISFGIAITLGSFLSGLLMGSVSFSLYDVVQIFRHNVGSSEDEMLRAILLYYRLPRLFLVFMVGAMLSVSGVLMQAIFQNPLAEPYTLGVAGGAALGAVFFLYLARTFHLWMPWALTSGAIIGSTLALFLMLMSVFQRRRSNKTTLILWGVMVSAYTSALLTLVLTFSGDTLREAFSWLMGSAANRSYGDLVPVGLSFVLSLPFWVGRASVLDALSLGDSYAFAVGIRPERMRLWIGFAASLMAAGAVAAVGIVGFVGLLVPHLIRRIVGWGHSRLLPWAFWFGGLFLLWSDLLARTVLAPRELPLGVVTALLGIPVFYWILKSGRTYLDHNH